MATWRGCRPHLAAEDGVEHGQGVGARLATAGPRTRENIAALQRLANRMLLGAEKRGWREGR